MVTQDNVVNDYRLETILISQLDEGERARKDYGNLKPLALDIEERGLIQPICVLDRRSCTPPYDGETPFLLLAGGRRTRCCKELGRESIEAKVYSRDMTKWEQKLIELHENILRDDMSPAEKGDLLTDIHNLYVSLHGQATQATNTNGHGTRDTAALVGESAATVSHYMQISKYANVAPEIREAKTKSEAMKIVNDLKKKLAMEELAKRQRERAKQAAVPKGTTTSTAPVKETPDVILAKLQQKAERRFIVKDFFEAVPKIADRSIDLVELDPDWGINFVARKGHNPDEYQQLPPEQYEEGLRKFLKASYRILKDHSWLLLWYSIEDWHDTSIRILEEEGFSVCHMPAIWIKETGSTATPAYRLGDAADFFLYARKGTPRISEMGRNNTFYFRVLKADERNHPAEKPIELYEAILRTFCHEGQTIISPCAGSGNVLLASENLKINSIGFDTVQKHKDYYSLRVFANKPGDYKSYKNSKYIIQ